MSFVLRCTAFWLLLVVRLVLVAEVAAGLGSAAKVAKAGGTTTTSIAVALRHKIVQ